MALIKCPECKREVSDRANSCPACGCPIGNGGTATGSSGNTTFEKRINEYIKNGYKLTKRQGNTVKLHKFKKKHIVSLVLIPIIYITIFIIMATIMTNNSPSTTSYVMSQIYVEEIQFNLLIYGILIGIPFLILLIIASCISPILTISITRTGKIEERGNTLKNNRRL